VGGGLLIALISIAHVFISHFAIGGGLFLVLTERKAYREGDERLLQFVRKSSLFFVLIVLVMGAMTGVGIWFTIGLVHPSATSVLIHTFVWAWAIEWVLFIVEVTAAFVYYYAWDRLDRKSHLLVGWIYFVAAWLSLFVINGILTFMLTPGRWLETRSFWDAFFNPTFLPSLFLRTMVALALAGLYALVAASTLQPEDLRGKMVRYAAGWLWPAFFLLPFGAGWYLAKVPQAARDIALGGAPAVMIFLALSILFSFLIFAFGYLGPYRRPEAFSPPFAFLILVLGFLVTGTTEWVREAIRKPYVIYNYMYSNAILVGQKAEIEREGILEKAKWALVKGIVSGDDLRAGREVFRIQCESCHTIQGYNGIKPMVKLWGEEYIKTQLRHLDTLKGFMPPFMGASVEQRALAHWLASLSEPEAEEGPER